MINKICKYCNRKFKARYTAAKYCSQHCSGKATSPKTQFKKGHKQSEDVRKKISAIQVGRIAWNKGRSLNSEHVNKLIESHKGQIAWNKGKRMPSEVRIKLSGENSHFWKGGITSEVKRIRTSSKYKDWRIKVFERDNYTCQNCRQHGGKLNADHIKPFSTHPELRFEINNGKTLCESCHRKTPTFGRKALKYAVTILSICFCLITQAQTRFYLNLTDVPGQTPTVNAAWNVTSGNVVRMARTTKDGSTIASTQSGNTGAGAVRNILIKQFITQPLAAQTFTTKSLTGQIRENISSTNSRSGEMRIYFRKMAPDGTISEIGNTNSTGVLTTTLRNWTLTSLSFTVTLNAGDRLVWDVGWRYLTGTNTATNGTGSFGSSSATDLIASGTETTANNPWLEINQSVVFQKPYKGFF